MKNYKLRYALGLMVLFTLFLWSCEKDNNGDNNKDTIVEEIDTTINAIAVDKNNTKWIGTEAGLYKSVTEGYKHINISSSEKVYSLLYEETGDLLWIGTESGLVKASIADDDFIENATYGVEFNNTNVVSMYKDDDSKHWFGTLKGITLKDGDSWKKENFRINTQETIFAMTIEDFTINSIAYWDGDYFFATSGAKLYRAFDFNDEVDAFSGATQWDYPYNGNSITDSMFVVFVDKDGYQWMGGKEGVQVHIGHDPKDQGSFMYAYDELPDKYVFAINQAPNGDVWIGTRKGIAVFDGANWDTITEGLPDLYITSIAFDSDGSAWIGTKKGLANIN